MGLHWAYIGAIHRVILGLCWVNYGVILGQFMGLHWGYIGAIYGVILGLFWGLNMSGLCCWVEWFCGAREESC